LVHLNLGRSMFAAMQLSQRNLFELGVVCFLITIASELRARDVAGREIVNTLRKAA
jgi:hypothetical protein